MSARTAAQQDAWDRRKPGVILDYFRVTGAPPDLQAIFDNYLAQAEAIRDRVPSNAAQGRTMSAQLQTLLRQRDQAVADWGET